MSQNSKQVKIEKMNKRIHYILFLPIILLLGIVPLVVQLRVVQTTEAVEKVFHHPQMADFFSQGKAIAIIALSVVMLALLFFLFDKTRIKKDKYIKIYMILMGIYALFTILSTVFSPYKHTALWGVPDRAEGMVILLCYILMTIYTIYTFSHVEDYKFIVMPLAFLVGCITILGFFQYIGKDIMVHTEFGKNLIIPKAYESMKDSIGITIPKGTVYGTFFNPNYVGSFVALMLPLFATLTLGMSGIKKKAFFGTVSICSAFLLVASGSRAGMIGCTLALIVGLIFSGKKLIEHKKLVLAGIGILILTLVGANIVTKGKLQSQGTRLWRDITAIFSSEKQDYKEQLLVKDLSESNGQIKITTKDDALTVEKKDNQLLFLDEQDNEVPYILNKNYYSTKDKRFNFILFKVLESEQQSEQETLPSAVLLNIKGVYYLPIRLNDPQGLYFIDPYTQEKIILQEAPSIGFKGKERVGSSRGYIWSHTLPIMKQTLFIGKGPDTYALAFPQDDYLAKSYALYNPHTIVDKPHNLYLQIGVNQGVIALLVFIVLVLCYIVQSFKLYGLKDSYGIREVVGIGVVLAVIAYLGAGIFNDSVVSIAPLFWILLGVGIAINYMTKHRAY